MIMRVAAEEVRYHDDCIAWPGSEIPDWFDNQSVGDSIIVEPPLPPQTCSDWVGIAFCVVFEDSAPPDYKYLQIRRSWKPYDDTFTVGDLFVLGEITVGDLSSQHLLVSYLPRNDPYQLSFEGHYWPIESAKKELKTSSIIKKCGARLVYKRDLEEFSRILKIPMPAVYGYDDEAGPIDSGSGSSDDDDEPISKRFKKV